MKDKRTPQEVVHPNPCAACNNQYIEEEVCPLCSVTDIAHARRVTAEYMYDGKSKQIKGQYWINRKLYRANQWNPHTDYNQLMMVVEKAFKEKLITDRLCLKLWGNGEYVAYPSVEATPHPVTKDLRIAILLCISNAIESLKK